MMTRFLAAFALALAAAGLFAGGDTSAQAPPAQKPASAGEKQAKPPKPAKQWPPDAATLQKRRLEAEAVPLFAGVEPVEIVITADFKAVQRDRNPDSKKLYPGTIAIVKDGAAGTPIPIELRTRGHVRRKARLCEFAPLRLELPKATDQGHHLRRAWRPEARHALPERRRL